MDEPITIHLKLSAKLYRNLKTEAMTAALVGGMTLLPAAWAEIFRQVDKDVAVGATEVTADMTPRKKDKDSGGA